MVNKFDDNNENKENNENAKAIIFHKKCHTLLNSFIAR